MSLESITAKTSDILGRIVKKTPLNHKLLSRPPFKYLHDIISELIASTGYAKGLFSPSELDANNVKDKESKIAFLTKIIDVVGISTGVYVKANPLKIVAGLEPEYTNLFLQLLGKAAIKKVDSSKAVKAVLAGEHQRPKNKSTDSVNSLTKSVDQVNTSQSDKLNQQEQSEDEPQTNLHDEKSEATKPERPPTSRGKIRTPLAVEPDNQLQNDEQEDDNSSDVLVKNNESEISKRSQEDQPSSEVEAKEENAADSPKPRMRPTTARMAPPKLKNNVVEPEQAEIIPRPVVSKVNTEEDEDFVVVTEDQTSFARTLDSSDVHGALVKKMIEAADKTVDPLKNGMSNLASTLDYKQDIENIRSVVQKLCMSVAPLGKGLDLVQEDIDAMNRELDNWRLQRSRLEDLLQEESKKCGKTLTALEAQLKDLKSRISEQNLVNQSLKATIYENEKNIETLLMSIAQPVR